jgi:hypothetical protein
MSATFPGRPEVLVLDFDGVLCDAIEECTLVAHLAHAGLGAGDFVDPGLAGVPAAVIERVRRCRPLMRHLGHFLVPLVDTLPAQDRATFAARFARIPQEQVEAFVDAATSIRAAVRHDHEAQWLEHHHVDARLTALPNGAYIATARDANSVRQVLRAHGVELNRTRIFHSLRDKTRALEVIAARESALAADMGVVGSSCSG